METQGTNAIKTASVILLTLTILCMTSLWRLSGLGLWEFIQLGGLDATMWLVVTLPLICLAAYFGSWDWAATFVVVLLYTMLSLFEPVIQMSQGNFLIDALNYGYVFPVFKVLMAMLAIVMCGKAVFKL